MPESTETTAATEATTAVVTPATVATHVAPAVAQATPGAAATTVAAENVADLPAWAQKIITDTRAEAAAARVTGKTAADDAAKALTQSIGKALGLVDDDAPPDPAALTAQIAETNATARAAQVELAVFRAAGAAGADASALLDSRSFLDSIKDTDPTDTAAIAAAITKATTTNPRLKATQAAARSGGDLTGGTGEGAITKATFDAMTPSQKNELFQKDPTLYRTLTGR